MSIVRCVVIGGNIDGSVGLCDRFNAPIIHPDGLVRILYLENNKLEYIDLQIEPDKYDIVVSDATYNKGSLFIDIREGETVGSIVI